MVNVGTNNQSNREEWLEKVLKRIPSGSRILDAGAGEQKYKKFCNHLNYVSQDFAQYDGKGNHGKLDITSDITDIPEPGESFDVIMCIEVFEHLPNPILALEEFSRLLRKGGQLILTAPFCSLTHFAPYHFSTGFNRYYYEYHLPVYGFEITEIQPNGNYFEYIAQELRRSPSIITKYSTAKAPSAIERWALHKVIDMVGRVSDCDSKSQEVLCYGYQVIAVKRGKNDSS
jgi:ubiquinone/menaquinone biosynthesis C-methylase UbiE